jgi:hypothetical protein
VYRSADGHVVSAHPWKGGTPPLLETRPPTGRFYG